MASASNAKLPVFFRLDYRPQSGFTLTGRMYIQQA